jgi:hypothetical protein
MSNAATGDRVLYSDLFRPCDTRDDKKPTEGFTDQSLSETIVVGSDLSLKYEAKEKIEKLVNRSSQECSGTPYFIVNWDYGRSGVNPDFESWKYPRSGTQTVMYLQQSQVNSALMAAGVPWGHWFYQNTQGISAVETPDTPRLSGEPLKAADK